MNFYCLRHKRRISFLQLFFVCLKTITSSQIHDVIIELMAAELERTHPRWCLWWPEGHWQARNSPRQHPAQKPLDSYPRNLLP